jgi:hypothetical protein
MENKLPSTAASARLQTLLGRPTPQFEKFLASLTPARKQQLLQEALKGAPETNQAAA